MSEDATIKHSEDSRIAEKAALIGFGAFLSKILGLLRDLIIAQTVPLAVSDAWVLAFRIPHLIRRLFSEGLVNAFFWGRQQTWVSFGWWVTIWSGCVFGLSLFQIPILKVLSATTVADPLSVQLFERMIFYLWSLGVSAYLLALAHQRGKLKIVSFYPVIFNLIVVLALVSSKDLLFRLSTSLSWAGVLQILFLLPQLQGLQKGSFAFFANLPQTQYFARSVIAFSYLQFLGLLTVLSSASLSEGSLSFFFWAERLLEFPLSLISTTLGLAGVATLVYEGQGRRDYLYQSLAWLLPSVFGLLLARSEVVSFLFGSNHFSALEEEQFIQLMIPFSFLLLGIGLYKMVLWMLVSQKRVPGLRFFLGHLFLAGMLTWLMQKNGSLRVFDLSVMYSILSFLLAGHCLMRLQDRQKILITLIQVGVPILWSCGVMSVFILLVQKFVHSEERLLSGVIIASAGLVYLASKWLLKRMIPERGTLG